MPFNCHGKSARAALREGLRGQHMLHFAGADAESQRAESPVGGGVTIAAHYCHARLREPELGADHMDYALSVVPHRIQSDAELGAVLAQHLHLPAGDLIGYGQVDVGGGHIVVFGGKRQVGAAHRPASVSQTFKSLRGSHLVDEMQVYVEQVPIGLFAPYDMAFPDFLAQRA